jgi:hypothetical protein
MTTTRSSPATPSARNLVRPPTSGELAQLWDFYVEQGQVEMYQLEKATWVELFWIAVFDDYITGCPGYAGKVMYVVWDGAPYACDVFGWQQGKLELFESYGA